MLSNILVETNQLSLVNLYDTACGDLSQFVELSVVRLDPDFNFKSYLSWFDNTRQCDILSFYHKKDQLSSFVSKLLQHYYLARRYNISPHELQIDHTEYGKPYIANPGLINRISFNISHSNSYVVLAIFDGELYNIGVDVEEIDYNNTEIKAMSALVFSPSECAIVGNSSELFYKLWTKKEALIKAHGSGFGTALYMKTNLNLNNVEQTAAYIITTRVLDNYFLSICLSKK